MGSQDCCGEVMGEITFIKNGLATTIHENGSKTSMPIADILCDGCNQYQLPEGGRAYREHGETVLWLCVYCK